MSIASLNLQMINLDIDETKSWASPNITINSGGQIIAIADGGGTGDDTIAVQDLAAITDELAECSDIIETDNAAIDTIQTDITATALIISNTTDLITVLTNNINTLIENEALNIYGSQLIVNLNAAEVMAYIFLKSGTNYLTQRAFYELYSNAQLPAGTYLLNINFGLSLDTDNGGLIPDDTKSSLLLIQILVGDVPIIEFTQASAGYKSATLYANTPYIFTTTETNSFKVQLNIFAGWSSGGANTNWFFLDTDVFMNPIIPSPLFNKSILNLIRIG